VEDNSRLTTDPRYISSGFETNEHDVQKENGVLGILTYSPSFHKFVDASRKSSLSYTGWTRPTIAWDLNCEHKGKSRKEAYRAF